MRDSGGNLTGIKASHGAVGHAVSVAVSGPEKTMRPTDILSAEHRVIEQVLDCLDAIATRAEQKGRLCATDASDALEFFVNFSDKCHHGKEENLLFPAMERRGLSQNEGPTAVMRNEHMIGRNHVTAMKSSLDAAAEGDAAALKTFVIEARGFARMLREHIQKEDHCLFGMANSLLTAEEQTALLVAFEEVELHKMEPGLHQRMLDLARVLSQRNQIPFRTTDGVDSCCCSR